MAIKRIPDTITESWQWLTDTIVANDGTEQRIAIRDYPRRTFGQKFSFDSESDLREFNQVMFGELRSSVDVPLWQYQTRITAAAAIGATSISCDETVTELRNGGKMWIAEGTNSQLLTINSVAPTSIGFVEALTAAYTTKATVMPSVSSLSTNNAVLNRSVLHNFGEAGLTFQETSPQIPFVRASNSQTLLTLDGMPILNKRAVGDNFEQSYDTGIEFVDYGSGNLTSRNTWLHAQMEFNQSYLCQRVLTPSDWDWWKVFADYCKGSQKPFLLPSYRRDLVDALGNIPSGSGSVICKGTEYINYFYPYQAFRHIMIQTDAGTHYATVQNGGFIHSGIYSAFGFLPVLPSGAGWTSNQVISFLYKVRIADDKINIEHDKLHSNISLTARTVDG